MHCIHESVYLLPVAFTAALCRKIAFYQHCLTQPGVHIKNICTFYINLGFSEKRINKSKTTKYANINTLPLKLGPLFSYCLENMHIRGHSHTGNNSFCLSEHKQHHTFNIYCSCCYYKPCLTKFI